MFSRLSVYAALFAVLATTSLAFATSAPHAAGLQAVPVVQLQTVVVTGHRTAADRMN
jgi:hypothetical protein